MNTEKTAPELTAEDLRLISQFSRKELNPDELFTFSVALCDNEIDRDNERFTVSALHKMAELYIGKTGIFDHNMSSKDQNARIYSTEVVTDESQKTSLGEPYTSIVAKAYMVRTEKNKDLIAEIDAGIKKETSVGCSMGVVACSVCGKNLRNEACGHVRGKTYGNKICHYILDNPTDAYEWSFVAVPAQRKAGVVKSFTNIKECDEASLWADEYRSELKSALLRDAASVMPGMKSEVIEGICSELSTKALRDMRDAFRAEAEKNLPLVRQLSCDEGRSENSDSEYKI